MPNHTPKNPKIKVQTLRKTRFYDRRHGVSQNIELVGCPHEFRVGFGQTPQPVVAYGGVLGSATMASLSSYTSMLVGKFPNYSDGNFSTFIFDANNGVYEYAAVGTPRHGNRGTYAVSIKADNIGITHGTTPVKGKTQYLATPAGFQGRKAEVTVTVTAYALENLPIQFLLKHTYFRTAADDIATIDVSGRVGTVPTSIFTGGAFSYRTVSDVTFAIQDSAQNAQTATAVPYWEYYNIFSEKPLNWCYGAGTAAPATAGTTVVNDDASWGGATPVFFEKYYRPTSNAVTAYHFDGAFLHLSQSGTTPKAGTIRTPLSQVLAQPYPAEGSQVALPGQLEHMSVYRHDPAQWPTGSAIDSITIDAEALLYFSDKLYPGRSAGLDAVDVYADVLLGILGPPEYYDDAVVRVVRKVPWSPTLSGTMIVSGTGADKTVVSTISGNKRREFNNSGTLGPITYFSEEAFPSEIVGGAVPKKKIKYVPRLVFRCVNKSPLGVAGAGGQGPWYSRARTTFKYHNDNQFEIGEDMLIMGIQFKRSYHSSVTSDNSYGPGVFVPLAQDNLVSGPYWSNTTTTSPSVINVDGKGFIEIKGFKATINLKSTGSV